MTNSLTGHSVQIAFDFGTKNIGIAVGQTLTQTTSELAPIKAKEGIPDWNEIKKIVNEWHPSIAIVGLPLNMDGSEQEMTRRARKFGNRLREQCKLPVEFIDERLTSFEAKERAHQAGHKGHYGSQPIDSIAASVILESWWTKPKS